MGMGIENMRRWPMYIVFAVCILLTLSLFNSWSLENELRNRIAEISRQLQDCSKQQTSCMDDSMALIELKDNYIFKIKELEKQKAKLIDDAVEYKDKASKADKQVNRTLVDVELCKTELQSLKNLQISKSATLETLRLEKETLTQQLTERKQKIEVLENEIDKLKAALTSKSLPSPANPVAPSQASPAAAPPKQSPSINNNNNNVLKNPLDSPVPENPVQNNPAPDNPVQESPARSNLQQENPINEPVLDNHENNDAKEDLEDNMINDGDGFDPQIK